MSTSFRIPYFVYKRNMGVWDSGVYTPDDDATNKITILGTIQMPSVGDMQAIEANIYGRRAGRHIKIYTDTRLQPVSQSASPSEVEYPGDLILYDGRMYLIFGEADFTALSKARSTRVSHYCYYACEMIEGYPLEAVP